MTMASSKSSAARTQRARQSGEKVDDAAPRQDVGGIGRVGVIDPGHRPFAAGQYIQRAGRRQVRQSGERVNYKRVERLYQAAKLQVRRRKRKARGSDSSAEDTDQTVKLPPGTLSGGIWDETIDICHYNAETGGYDVTSVSTVLVPNYLNAGDTLYIDCCTDAECGPLPCLAPTNCVQGACAYDVKQKAGAKA